MKVPNGRYPLVITKDYISVAGTLKLLPADDESVGKAVSANVELLTPIFVEALGDYSNRAAITGIVTAICAEATRAIGLLSPEDAAEAIADIISSVKRVHHSCGNLRNLEDAR